MTDERVRRIQEALTRAQVQKDLHVRQDLIAKQAREAETTAKEKAIKVQNEAKLRATGVVDLFEGLRDAGVVKWSNKPIMEDARDRFDRFMGSYKEVKVGDYRPAKVEFSWDCSSVSLLYDMESRGSGGEEEVIVEDHREISAGFNKAGELVIGGILVKGQEGIERAVAQVILSEPKKK